MIEIPSPAEQSAILRDTLPGKALDFILGRRKSRRRRPGVDISGWATVRAQRPDGSFSDLDWVTFPNGATYEGLNKVLDSAFRNQTQVSAWYCGLIAGGTYSAVSVNDTAASHAGWSEEQQYTAGTRPQWSPSVAALGQLTISTAISLTTSATVLVQGIFVTSIATKGNSTGTLWATAVEGSPRSIASGLTYQFYYSTLFSPTS